MRRLRLAFSCVRSLLGPVVVSFPLVLVLAAPAFAADHVLIDDGSARVTSLSAYGGVLVWARSAGSDDNPRIGYRQLVHGTPRPLAIRSRRGNGVIDVGPRQGGGIAAVYERCRRYPP